MQKRINSITNITILAGLFLFGHANAQVTISKENVSFKSMTLIDGDTTVNGELRLPNGGERKIPAVVVIHSSGGVEDTTGTPYIEALNQAGIATLELKLFSQGGRPKSTRINLPHTYGALIYLANLPRIDSAKIGVMGFSWGGLLSMFSASNEITQEYTGGKYQFAAHVPLYPVCWAHLAAIEGKNPVYKPSIYQVLTGAPVHILAGEKDNYDDPDTCQKFINALPESARQHVNLTMYPNATHGWDTPVDKNYFDGTAYKGQGGNVSHFRNAAAAEKSKAFVLEFFKSKLGTQ